MLAAMDVAAYFLATQDEDGSGEGITNLKLQKLCYYAQGFHLAIYDSPLFGDPLEAWEHGPVVPALYRRFKSNGNAPIPVVDPVPELPVEITELLDEVARVYGQYSGWKLRNMTHEEAPWIEASEASNRVISLESMQRFFKTMVAA